MAGRVVIDPSAKHTATLIFLHGLGDTGHGWAGAMSSIRSSQMKVICPTAPTMPVTLNAGFRMPSWFDLRSLDDKTPEDAAGIRSARDTIHGLIEDEVKAGIPSNRIVLGGFSQGGALALYSAFTYPKALAGVMALSCWLPLRDEFPGAVTENRSAPILQCHGDCDPLVPYKWGQMTTQAIRKFAPQIEFKTYPGMMHSSCDAELADMKKFVQTHLPPQ
ncbi:acyl-protein thioesterase 1-like [Pollicipes pollicipes]|uniref:acyl-protein thioesterase 1-like n=1 Tax=Pollicipes pollicipes TaxID=41117 RepID=UPI001885875F|nr:acyl-protein thioesterase 1-like [Pollicipes pollicipes]XP_037085904.1 acyl-protein thioesterase 1-like [Pollicipes pollicipes]